ncbi:DUF58 domain-containing protein [Sporosarcina gallistercoris]|uniref:DUF58 domain-containing protein n=1 Tax=Sporosarcina gallistercoris TaxID=2762245 RepID=A0ABR8PGJ3_9BACL|nr:DUF58 domain-containing protein [Sporosarcina gallistercoris]MBD7907283.1 DUF58 domain-containing protein [Sporosarcina gallistercoris]
MTSFFPSSLTARLGRLSFVQHGGRLGHHKGSHVSKKTGSSLEFSDFKEYHPGDDIRHIDWNVYARTDSYFIKQFLDEQEMRVHILLDTSKSMDFEDKWKFAQQIAIGLGQIALKNGDTVSISRMFSGKKQSFTRKGARQAGSWTTYISRFEQPSETTGLLEGIHAVPKGTTLLFVVTDALEPNENLDKLFKQLSTRYRDVRVVAIRSKTELSPSYQGDIRFIDSESERISEVTMMPSVETAYQLQQKKHQLLMMESAAKYGIGVLMTTPQTGPEDVFTMQMRRQGWVR